MVGRQTLYLAGNVLSGSNLKKEAELRAAAGLSARYLTAGELGSGFSIDREGAILSDGNLALGPVKLTAGLLFHARSRGARLFAPEEAVKNLHRRSSVEVTTRSDHRIDARHVVLATGYELTDIVKSDRHHVIRYQCCPRRRCHRSWCSAVASLQVEVPFHLMRVLIGD